MVEYGTQCRIRRSGIEEWRQVRLWIISDNWRPVILNLTWKTNPTSAAGHCRFACIQAIGGQPSHWEHCDHSTTKSWSLLKECHDVRSTDLVYPTHPGSRRFVNVGSLMIFSAEYLQRMLDGDHPFNNMWIFSKSEIKNQEQIRTTMK